MTSKTVTPKATPSHPTYSVMIKATFQISKSLSKIRIDKYIKDNYTVNDASHARSLKVALKRMLSNGILVKPKGTGLGGSFKLNKSVLDAEAKKAKKAIPKVTKNTVIKKPAKKPVKKLIKKPTPPDAKKLAKKVPLSGKPATKKPIAKKPKTPTKKPKAPTKKPKTPIKKPVKKPVAIKKQVTKKVTKSPKKVTKTSINP